jgi:nickel-type superoxide dismutase maturation protease
MFQVLRVTGESLSPFFLEGDFVVIIKIPFLFRTLRCGDVIVFRHPIYGTLIKKIESITRQPPEARVVGAHENSVDSRIFGPVPRSAIIGKVIWHIRKPGL